MTGTDFSHVMTEPAVLWEVVGSGAVAILEGYAEQGIATPGHWEWLTEFDEKRPMNVGNIHLVTDGLPETDHVLTGVRVTSSLQAAVEGSLDQNSDRAVAVIPEGPYIVPFFRATEAVCETN